MPISYQRASRDTIVTVSGQSLYTTTGIYLFSGSERGQCTLLTTGNSFTTFKPPSIAPGNLRSGQLSVYNLYGSANTNDYLIYLDPVYISGIFPFSGFSGENFKISGSGIRDLTGLWFNDLYTGVLTDPVFENSTWIRSGQVPFISGGLNSYFTIKGMSEGGSSVSPRLFYVREQGISLSGIANFPTPLQAENYLRGTPAADGLEWRTPNQVLIDITGVSKSGGDSLTGNYRFTGGAIYTSGLVFHNTGLATGETIFRTTIFSGNYLVLDAIVGGINYRGFSLKFS
mgnify:CR=1 FL=1